VVVIPGPVDTDVMKAALEDTGKFRD